MVSARLGLDRRRRARALLVVAALATIGCDRVTKHAATVVLAGLPDQSFLADTVRLGYVENPGGFLSLGATLPPVIRDVFFTGVTGVTICVVVVFAMRRTWGFWAASGLTLFVAGAGSNWIDRVTRGTVVDFLNLGVGSLRTGVFNVADVAILLGAALFIFSEFRRRPTT